MKTLLLILFIFSQFTFAYIPTLDSLLRNGNNTDIGNNTVIVNLSISKKNNIEILEAENITGVSKLLAPQSFRLQVFNEREDFPKMVQLQYANGFEMNQLYDVKVVPYHSLKAFSKNDEKVEQRFFFAIMRMLLTNSSDLLLEFLDEQGVNVKRNSELVNKDKQKLLFAYKEYLNKLKSESSVNSDLENPLRPKDEEEAKKVREIMGQSYLQADGLVQRNKSGDYFNWLVSTDRLFVSFDETHRITEISLKTNNGELKASFGRFLILGSNIEFPETIMLTDFAGNSYEVRAYKVMIIADDSKKFYKRLEMYKEKIQENAIKDAPEPSIFML